MMMIMRMMLILLQGCALPWPPENCIEMWKAEKAQVATLCDHHDVTYDDYYAEKYYHHDNTYDDYNAENMMVLVIDIRQEALGPFTWQPSGPA